MRELPRGWAIATLPELVTSDGLFSDGDWVETKDQDPQGEVRLTQLADIGEGAWRDRSRRYMSREVAERLRCTELRPGDVLVARMPDPLGRACIFPGDSRPCVTVVDVCIVRPGDSSVDARWLMWWLNAPQIRAEVLALQAGTTRKRISRKNLGSVPIPVPPLAEQRRIVLVIEEQLSRLETAEGAITSAEARLEVFRRSAEVSWLSGDWPSRPLADLVEPERPIRYGILMPKEHVEDGVPYVRVRDFPHGRISVNELRRTSREIAEQYRRSSLKPGDLLVSIRGTYGRVAMVPPELDGANITQDTARLALTQEVNRDYVVAYLRSEPAQRFLRSVARGVAVRGVNLGDLREMPVPIPPPEVQLRIAESADRVSTVIAALVSDVEVAVRQSNALRRSILAHAFRGELVPQDPADEPASVLLERIAAERAAAPARARRRVSAGR